MYILATDLCLPLHWHFIVRGNMVGNNNVFIVSNRAGKTKVGDFILQGRFNEGKKHYYINGVYVGVY